MATGVRDRRRRVLALWPGVSGVASQRATPASRPNIVLMFPDNLGWGEVNVYGGVRGPITPRVEARGRGPGSYSDRSASDGSTRVADRAGR